MALAFFKSKTPGSSFLDHEAEQKLGSATFTVHKFNGRVKPRRRDRVKVVACFSEFGCEVLGCLYCIPLLLRRYPGQYVIAMGWHGRAYLYRHLVDEFWELGEKHMWLRDYAHAFHNRSRNLKKIEEAATLHGDVIPSAALGKFAIGNLCRTCGKFWHEWRERAAACPGCKSTLLFRSIFSDTAAYKAQARRIPPPRQEYLDWAAGLVGDNAVGVFARNRRTYGRNLPPDFYVKLVALLEGMGYRVVWLGERQSTLACPVGHVYDFSRTRDADDLERTLAVVGRLKFTVQFWTASTRLAGAMGVPFLLFESPEQIYSSRSGLMAAQEGRRLELCSFGPKKVVLSHYQNAYEDPAAALALVARAVREMNDGNWDDVLGLVEDEWFSTVLQTEYYEMLA